MTQAIRQIRIPELPVVKEGKVRTIFQLPDGHLLVTASDRISAFDVVLPSPIPDKGKVLTQLSNYWFRTLTSIPRHHLVETDFTRFPAYLAPYADMLKDRSIIARKADVIPFECVVRGYISGSLWKAYLHGEHPYGLALPDNLQESSPFPEPIFTPTTKADSGHDMPVTHAEMADAIGWDLTRSLRDLAIEIFIEGSKIASRCDIILADTKFEFGLIDNEIYLIDECLTPDSSRFWPRSDYLPGRSQPSYDKQFVRDYLNTLDWDKKPPAPDLPDDVVQSTRMKYLDVHRLLTGSDLP
ncbi:phosphoribosylaminoimidazolesuccinocarboxamide synthase [bacterium]|nr:phosphoribosylaminoimidazolesuccinocarboxamide synthase [candidate division CSSED10-310 bacterium]